MNTRPLSYVMDLSLLPLWCLAHLLIFTCQQVTGLSPRSFGFGKPFDIPEHLLSWFKCVSHVKGSSMRVTSSNSNWNTSSLGSSNLICPEKIHGSSQYSAIRAAECLFTFLPNKVTSFFSSPTFIRKAVPFL